MASAPLTADMFLGESTERRVRHGFIQKVYGIVSVQLLVTAVVGAAVMRYSPAIPESILTLLFWVSLLMTVAVSCTLMCKPSLTRKVPHNYILLSIFTVCEAFLVGFVSAQYTQESILLALGITTIVVFSLTLFACQTAYDFTGMCSYLFAVLMTLVGFGFVLSIASFCGFARGPAFQGLRLLYALGGALLFSCYLVYDTQLIVGGKHNHHEFSVDDYVMAALNLYVDIIGLFLRLLQLFGRRR